MRPEEQPPHVDLTKRPSDRPEVPGGTWRATSETSARRTAAAAAAAMAAASEARQPACEPYTLMPPPSGERSPVSLEGAAPELASRGGVAGRRSASWRCLLHTGVVCARPRERLGPSRRPARTMSRIGSSAIVSLAAGRESLALIRKRRFRWASRCHVRCAGLSSCSTPPADSLYALRFHGSFPS